MKTAATSRGGITSDAGRWKQKLSSILTTLWPGTASEADLARAHLGEGSGKRLLDVGCGDGALLEGLRNSGWDAVGLDPDANAVEAARSRGIDARVGAVPPEAFSGIHFDAVVACHVIEHVPDPTAFLVSLREATKPRGSLVILTPNSTLDMSKPPRLAARIRSELSVVGAARALHRDAMGGEELVMVACAS